MIGSPSPGGLIALDAVFLFLATLAVGLRFRARWKDHTPYGPDDWTILASYVTYIAIWIIPTFIGAVAGGLGSHLRIDPATGMQERPNITFTKTHFVYITFGVIPPGLGRLSILLFYKRIFLGKVFTIVIWTLIAYTISWTVSFTLVYLFKCGAPSTVIYSAESCIDIWDYFKALGITSPVSDFLILLVPWIPLYRLNMRKPLKVSVGILFLLGNLAFAASVVRCVVLYQVDALILGGQADFTWDDGVNGVWALVESGVIIICACLPTLGRYLWRSFPDRVESLHNTVKNKVLHRGHESNKLEHHSPADRLRFDLVKPDSYTSLAGSNRKPNVPNEPGQIAVVREFETRTESM